MTVYVLNPHHTKVFCNEWIGAEVTAHDDVELEFVLWCGQKSFVTPYGTVPPPDAYRVPRVPVPVSVLGRPFVLVRSWTRFRALEILGVVRIYLDPAAPLVPPPRRT